MRRHRKDFAEMVANRKAHDQERLRAAAAKRKPAERLFSPRINKRSEQMARDRVRSAPNPQGGVAVHELLLQKGRETSEKLLHKIELRDKEHDPRSGARKDEN